MGKVKIKVDWCDKNFAACPENENIACVVTHKTLEGLQKDMEEALRQHVEWMIEDGDALPAEFVGDMELEYNLTHVRNSATPKTSLQERPCPMLQA